MPTVSMTLVTTFIRDEVIQLFEGSWVPGPISFLQWFLQRNLNNIHGKSVNVSVRMPKTHTPFQGEQLDTILAGAMLKDQIQRVYQREAQEIG